MKFVIQSLKLHLKGNSLESYTSPLFNYICQEKIIADDYASVNKASAVITRTAWQFHLYDNYSETRTVINVFLFNFASELANCARLKEILRSSGLGRFYYPNHPVNIACGKKPEYPKEIYDCRLTAPGWRESLRSSGLGRFYYPNHPVNIACGKKPEYPKEIYDCRQAIHELLTRKRYESEVGIETTISEVTGACSDHCATWSLLCRTKQSYTRNLNSLALARVSL